MVSIAEMGKKLMDQPRLLVDAYRKVTLNHSTELANYLYGYVYAFIMSPALTLETFKTYWNGDTAPEAKKQELEL